MLYLFTTHTQADSFNYSENTTSVIKIAQEEDNYLYWGYKIELKNGLKFKTDLNATNIYAPNQKLLFDYSDFIFKHLGKDAEECKRLIISNPNQSICLTSLDETEEDMDNYERPF